MKRKIGLVLILLVELFIGLVHNVKYISEAVGKALPFITDIATKYNDWLNSVTVRFNVADFTSKWCDPIRNFLHLTNGQFSFVFIVFALNVLFIVVYLLVFGIIAAIIKAIRRHNRKKRIASQYVMTVEDEKKFEYQRYMKKFPIKRVISLLIPLAFIVLFIIARFDRTVASGFESCNDGYWQRWTWSIAPFFEEFSPNLGNDLTKIVYNTDGWGYINILNRFLTNKSLFWVEFIILGVAAILLLLVWYLFFTLINLCFRKSRAKKRAAKARERYISKREKAERKALKKSKAKVSAKASDLLGPEETIKDPDEESQIAHIADIDLDSDIKVYNEKDYAKQAEYIDDISEGVQDLGVVSATADYSEPIIERETRFVGDEEVDIVLDEEPVIEVVLDEEDPNEAFVFEEEEDPYFEKYQPEYVDLSLITNLPDKDVSVVKEEEVEPVKPEEKPIIIERYIEKPVYIEKTVYVEKPQHVDEEPIKEEEEPVIEKFVEKEEPRVVEEKPITEPIQKEEPVQEVEKDPVQEVEEELVETEEEKAERILRKDIKPIAVVRSAEIFEEEEKKNEKVSVLTFKPKGNNQPKNIKPLDLSNRPALELKKYVSSNVKVGGSLSPTEAFATGTTRVAPVVRPISALKETNFKNPAAVPVVNKEKEADENKFKDAKKKMIQPIAVNKPINHVESAPKKVAPIAPLKPVNKDVKKPVKPVNLKK